jgi:hypothetical protein
VLQTIRGFTQIFADRDSANCGLIHVPRRSRVQTIRGFTRIFADRNSANCGLAHDPRRPRVSNDPRIHADFRGPRRSPNCGLTHVPRRPGVSNDPRIHTDFRGPRVSEPRIDSRSAETTCSNDPRIRTDFSGPRRSPNCGLIHDPNPRLVTIRVNPRLVVEIRGRRSGRRR